MGRIVQSFGMLSGLSPNPRPITVVVGTMSLPVHTSWRVEHPRTHSCKVVTECTSELPLQVQPWHVCAFKSFTNKAQTMMANTILSPFNSLRMARLSLSLILPKWVLRVELRKTTGIAPDHKVQGRLAVFAISFDDWSA
jgi:hypothetical protein